MRTVTIRELHAKTGELVREAARQGQILVTDNGRLVARILPESEGTGAPYFATRKPSRAFLNLEKSGRSGRGRDVTRLISENREDRV